MILKTIKCHLFKTIAYLKIFLKWILRKTFNKKIWDDYNVSKTHMLKILLLKIFFESCPKSKRKTLRKGLKKIYVFSKQLIKKSVFLVAYIQYW